MNAQAVINLFGCGQVKGTKVDIAGVDTTTTKGMVAEFAAGHTGVTVPHRHISELQTGFWSSGTLQAQYATPKVQLPV